MLRERRGMKQAAAAPAKTELVIITGLSGSGKGTVLKALEDLGYYSVDNLPIDLIPKFAQLTKDAPTIRRAALVVDIREGAALERFPALFKRIRRLVPTRLIFLEADDASLIRRFSETRRPHPLGTGQSVSASIRREREQLEPIRKLADPIINTTKFNVHELRETIHRTFGGPKGDAGNSGAGDQLRVPPRRAGGKRPGVRRAVSAQSQLHSGVQEL